MFFFFEDVINLEKKDGNFQYLRTKRHQPTGDPWGEALSYAASARENSYVLPQLKWIRYILYIFVFFVGMTSFSPRDGSHRITSSCNRRLFVEKELQGLSMWQQNVEHWSSGDTNFGAMIILWGLCTELMKAAWPYKRIVISPTSLNSKRTQHFHRKTQLSLNNFLFFSSFKRIEGHFCM